MKEAKYSDVFLWHPCRTIFAELHFNLAHKRQKKEPYTMLPSIPLKSLTIHFGSKSPKGQ